MYFVQENDKESVRINESSVKIQGEKTPKYPDAIAKPESDKKKLMPVPPLSLGEIDEIE
jgi:hypothetical protein